MQPTPIPIHGRMDRYDCPVAVELGGCILRVRHREPLVGRKIAALRQGDWRCYWRVTLEDGRTCVVYRDLNRVAWFLED